MLYLVVRRVFVAASHYKHFDNVDVTVMCGHHQRSSRLLCACVCVFATMRGSANLFCSQENPSVICSPKKGKPHILTNTRNACASTCRHTHLCAIIYLYAHLDHDVLWSTTLHQHLYYLMLAVETNV